VPAFGSVLVANRGEIVVRVCRTLAARGLASVAVYTEEDAGALHVRVAERALEVPGYLDGPALVAAALASGAEAVHPGYGFLSEDAGFARAVEAAGLVWIGPPASAIEAMGDKIRAKETVAAAGVPVVPGAGRPGLTDAELAEAARAVGLPVLLKPAAGGGGKGMRRVTDAGALEGAIAAARREAAGAFGDGTLLVERWVPRPRHVEVQVFADAHGNVVHLGERECSLQRRHQKIVEESPSPLLDEATRTAMTRSAVEAARACGYVGAGTVEFIVSGDRPDEYFFMEMNTRLQVEHPVTEAVAGVDLVEWQLRVAAGEPLPLAQPEIRSAGHAVEARVYAEDPARGFLPQTGTVALLAEAGGPGVRVDSALSAGTEVGTRYDPMLAKVVAWAPTRVEALARLGRALRETVVLGVATNVGYLTQLLGHPDVAGGRLDTELVDRTLGELSAPEARLQRDAAAAAAAWLSLALEPAAGGGPAAAAAAGPWDVPDGWQVGAHRPWTVELHRDGVPVTVAVRGRLASGADVRIDEEAVGRVRAQPGAGPGELVLVVDGETARWHAVSVGDDVWVGREGWAWRFRRADVVREGGGSHGASGPLRSPMPGVVVKLHVGAGDAVAAGDPLVSVEAMKMEHAVVARHDGIVSALWVREGQAVALDEPLAEVT
jgi:acetyl-CoA/propionyl-CoA carboxylase, biotin carboxylase, biotin carboxyl carrier protein